MKHLRGWSCIWKERSRLKHTRSFWSQCEKNIYTFEWILKKEVACFRQKKFFSFMVMNLWVGISEYSSRAKPRKDKRKYIVYPCCPCIHDPFTANFLCMLDALSSCISLLVSPSEEQPSRTLCASCSYLGSWYLLSCLGYLLYPLF